MNRSLPARGKRWLLVIFLVAAVVTIAIMVRSSRGGPTYKGKTVVAWTEEGTVPEEVINAFGADATPYLVAAWQRTPSDFNKAAWVLWGKLPASWRWRLRRWGPVDVPGASSRAAEWLRALGPDARAAVPALAEAALRHPDRFQRSFAINTLGLVGLGNHDALQTLAGLLNDPDDVVKDAATLAIVPFGTNGITAMPDLIKIVKSRPKPFNALLTLAFLGPDAREAVPVILERFKDPELRGNALTALSGIGSGNSGTASALVGSIGSLEAGEQVKVLETLLKIGPAAKSVPPMLTAVRDGQTNMLRLLAAMAIASIEQDPPEAMPVLIEALQGKLDRGVPLTIWIPSTRTTLREGFGLSPPAAAAWYLSQMDSAGQPALPNLKAVMAGAGHVWEKVLAARAIWRISGDATATAPTLAAHLKHDDLICLHYGLEALGEMGTNAASISPSLVGFINNRSNSWASRRQVLETLRRIDPSVSRGLSLH